MDQSMAQSQRVGACEAEVTELVRQQKEDSRVFKNQMVDLKMSIMDIDEKVGIFDSKLHARVDNLDIEIDLRVTQDELKQNFQNLSDIL